LAELAVSCEYLTIDKFCLAVSESPKAKAARQVRCENYEKMSCCYVCLFKRKCAIGCTYLGNFENEPQQIRDEKIEADNTLVKDDKSEVANSEKSPAVNCYLCNLEMCQAKTKIRLDSDDLEKLGEESLPVIVYLCPKCGKMEFVAEEKTRQKLLSKSLKP
jgi:hypothetical protein